MVEMNNQIEGTIRMADLMLVYIMDNNGSITWKATDLITDESVSMVVPKGKEHLFWRAIYIALSGEDDVEGYEEIEEALGFVNYTKTTRWIP